MTSTATVSASVRIAPCDTRCRYWAKIVRASTPLPLPAAVEGAAQVPGAYLRNGGEELFPGDVMIEGEEAHHRKARGWSYWVTWCAPDGKPVRMRDPGAEVKEKLKSSGLPPDLLSGSGGVAACIRVAHAVRLGIYTGI